jgi:hypothetical protein
MRTLWRRAVLPLLIRWGGRDADCYDKTPHSCFKAAFASGANADNELFRILESRLRTRFDSVRRIRIGFWGRRLVVLLVQVLQDSFSVNVGRSKYGNDEWILLIGPLDTQANNSRELLLVCRARDSCVIGHDRRHYSDSVVF